MTTVTALKALYVALGGSAATVANMVIIPDVVNAIATLVANGVILPDVTAADEGKVLTVDDEGKWKAAALPSSGT